MPDPQQKLVKVKDLGIVAFPGSMDDDKIAATIRGHKEKSKSKNGMDPRLADVGQAFPRLAPYLSNVHIQQGKKAAGDDRGLEFYPPWESQNPNPGKITLELFDQMNGPQLTQALGGDLLHYLGGSDPKTGKPVDPQYYAMKQQVLKARTPEQDKIDRQVYADAMKQGERRPYDQWLQQSRVDAYIRGFVTPELGGKYPDEWRKNGFYKDPGMLKAVEAIKKYVTTPANATPQQLRKEADRLKQILTPVPMDSTPKPPMPVATEESEHARQLKQAQPLSTATGPVSDFLNTSVIDQAGRIDKALNRAVGLPETNYVTETNRKFGESFDKQNPITAGAMQGASEFAKGLLTPANIGILLAAPEWKILSGYFAGKALVDAQRLSKQAEEAWKKGDKKSAAQFATEALMSAGIGGLAGAHAVRGTAMDTSSLHPTGPKTIEGQFERAPDSDIVPAWAHPTQRGPVEPAPTAPAAPAPALALRDLKARALQLAPPKFQPVQVPGNIVHRMPISTPQEIGHALDAVSRIEATLNTMPPPLEPIDTRTPQALEEWKQRHKEWLTKARPYLDQYQEAARNLDHLKNRGIGQVRQLPDGTKVVHLSAAGLQSLSAGIHQNLSPDFSMLGVVLTPENAAKVRSNILLRGGRHLDELDELFDKGKNKNGQIIVSAIPQAGETLSDALGRLREEISHGVQNGLSDALGNHVAIQDYDELNETMPEAMKDHLFENRYIDDDGSIRANRLRVREASAKLMSVAPVTFGITEDEASAYLYNYFIALTKQHGFGALDQLVHITNFARKVKEDFANAYKPTGTAAGRTEGAGVVSGVPAERTGGHQGGLAPPQPGIPSAAEPVGAPASLEVLKQQAAARAPEPNPDWLRKGAEQFAQQEGRTIGLPTYLTPDARAKEIADAYSAMQHNPNDPAVKAAYDAMTSDVDKQWDYATQVMGIHFEPWTKPGQPYQNSAEMTADVKNNKHLYFFQGGEVPADHPMSAMSGEFSYNDKLRAVHDLFGHAVGQFQFGPRGEENAWAAHAQMFSREALPALTTETKGQNSWVNFGPNMRDAQGNVLQQGQPGWLHPNERPYSENKAALLPERFHYRQDAPISFVSPNKFDLDLKGAAIKLGSKVQRDFASLATSLADGLHATVVTRNAIGHWKGGAENTLVHRFPVGTDPELAAYHTYNMGRLGYQYFTGSFSPAENGPDDMHAVFIDSAHGGPEQITNILAKHGIENSTIEPFEDGHVVMVFGTGSEMEPKVQALTDELGVAHGRAISGKSELAGHDENRESADREFLRRIEAIEQRHPEWAHVRQGWESRPDYVRVHRLIREAKKPFIEVTHGSRVPSLREIDPEKQGTGPQRGVERQRQQHDPAIYIPRSYFQVEGTPGERFYQNLPQQYHARLNYENIYNLQEDPDHLWDLVPPQYVGPRKTTFFEKAVRDAGYDGVYDPERGVIETFKGTPVEQSARDGFLFNLKKKPKAWNWKTVADYLGDDAGDFDTKDKRNAIVKVTNEVPDDLEFDAATKAGISGKLWYDRSSRAFDALVESQPQMFRKNDKNKFLNFVSALSPVQPVRQNLLMAVNLWDKWHKAGRPVDVVWTDTKNFKGVANKNSSLFRILKGRGNTFGVDLPSRLYNGIRALQDQPMSGPKVSAFAPNLGKDVDKSTNDTWMAIFANIDPARINEPKNYQAVTAKVRAAARKNNIDTRQAQAAIWSFIKALAELSGWGKDRWIPPQEIIKQGLLTPELINKHAADFADLLAKDREIRDRIKDIGGDVDALDKKLEKYVPGRPFEGTTAHVDPRLLNAAQRLEAARSNAKIEAHLARKSDAPTLFDTSFSDGVSFNLRRNLDDLKDEAEKRRPKTGLATMGEATKPKNLQEFIAKAKANNPAGKPLIEGRDFEGFFATDNYDLRHATGHNMLDPESVISGGELAKGLTYSNSRRQYPDIETYVKAASGSMSADELQRVAPRVRTVDQTETPEFKRWFGNSKVVDEQGKPLTVYHGTHAADFSEFKDVSNRKYGFYFTESPEYAGNYVNKQVEGGRLIPVHLRLTNPTTYEHFKEVHQANRGANAVDILKNEGYDGVVTTRGHEFNWPGEDNTRTFIVFDSTQIKSAIANRGSFDPLSGDITMNLKRVKDEAELRNPNRDRRRNPELRKRIDQMTPEEMRKLLLFDENTSLPNARSFHEAQRDNPAAAVAMSDADGLKAFNDKFGYEAGDTLLKAKAEALRQAGLDAYHDKGDEFLYRGESTEDLKIKLEKARDILRNTVFDVTMDDGTQLKLKGVDFSYGTGKDLDEAEHGQHQHKQAREQAGERKRGELGGITEVQGQDREHQSVEAPMNQKLSTQERDEFAELAEKDWKKTITTAEKLRYLQLVARDMQSKFGIAPIQGEAQEQWVRASLPKQTETPQFKQWFGNSQVVDNSGKPEVMYHATQSNINEFRPFTHFGTQKAASDRDANLVDFYENTIKNQTRYPGANIMPVFLRAENPLRLPDLAFIDMNTGMPLDKFDEAEEMDEDERPMARGWESEEAVANTLLEHGIIDIDEFEEARDNEDALKLLKKKGYDSIVYENSVEDPGHDSWIIFSPDQVKSAIGNRGTFDMTSSDITMNLTKADKSTPIPQIEKLKAEALQRDPRTIIPSKAQSEVVP